MKSDFNFKHVNSSLPMQTIISMNEDYQYSDMFYIVTKVLQYEERILILAEISTDLLYLGALRSF